MENHEQYKKVFNQFDKNGDGKISPMELQQCVSSIGGHMSVEDAEAAIKLMDSDDDGLLCLDGFMRLIEGVDEEEKARDLKEAFKMYVTEESAEVITSMSLKRMLSRLGQRRSEYDCKNMIARFDLNGDGVLSFDEFKVMMSS